MIVLIEFENKPLLFSEPKDIITCDTPKQMASCFSQMEKAVDSEHFLAGFMSYEAGYGFEAKLLHDTRYDFPLMMMGVYAAPDAGYESLGKGGHHKISVKGTNTSKPDYHRNIDRIREYISTGDVYQITYCKKFLFDHSGSAYSLYRALKKDQPVPYPAYIRSGGLEIASLSPEMFIKKRGSFVRTKPMKGTWMRGSGIINDLFAGYRLKCDMKNRAENIMITDLLRNDLGRIGTKVRAPKLFEVARYKTLYQLTSTVTCDLDQGIPFYELFKAIHPSGSVTGAPKIRAMEVIRELEDEPRNIYTGAIGYITPQRDLFFNVPIRTLLIRDGRGEMGVGGGIVWDSTPQGEYDECMLKARFLTEAAYPVI